MSAAKDSTKVAAGLGRNTTVEIVDEMKNHRSYPARTANHDYIRPLGTAALLERDPTLHTVGIIWLTIRGLNSVYSRPGLLREASFHGQSGHRRSNSLICGKLGRSCCGATKFIPQARECSRRGDLPFWIVYEEKWLDDYHSFPVQKRGPGRSPPRPQSTPSAADMAQLPKRLHFPQQTVVGRLASGKMWQGGVCLKSLSSRGMITLVEYVREQRIAASDPGGFTPGSSTLVFNLSGVYDVGWSSCPCQRRRQSGHATVETTTTKFLALTCESLKNVDDHALLRRPENPHQTRADQSRRRPLLPSGALADGQ